MPLGANKAAIMGVAGVSTGDVVLLASETASNSATITFTAKMSATYGEYVWRFYNINPATDGAEFQFQVNATDGADFNDSAITSSYFRAYNYESSGSGGALGYQTSHDLAQSTSFQNLAYDVGNGTDESAVGELHLFNPAGTTYAKMFTARLNGYGDSDLSYDYYPAGYINDTTAIDDIQFKMSAGNFDGIIKMWGIK